MLQVRMATIYFGFHLPISPCGGYGQADILNLEFFKIIF
jgi:hypothetical protein